VIRNILRRALVLMGAAVIPLSGMSGPASGPRLSFDVSEGLNLNSFLRDGPVAAHLVLRDPIREFWWRFRPATAASVYGFRMGFNP
jgi:hypothetical protein